MSHSSDPQSIKKPAIESRSAARGMRLLMMGESGSGRATLVKHILNRVGVDPPISSEPGGRYFSIGGHRFNVRTFPAEEASGRAMVAAMASTDLVVHVIDASAGVPVWTAFSGVQRSMLGWNRVALVVSKMDAVGYEESIFGGISELYRALLEHMGVPDVPAIPVSALGGDNLAKNSSKMPWYDGASFFDLLQQVNGALGDPENPLRISIRTVEGGGTDLREFGGDVVSGVVRLGDRVRVLPSGTVTEVQRVSVGRREVADASRGANVLIRLADEADRSESQLIAAADAPPSVADQFQTRLLWMADKPMISGRQYVIEIGNAPALCTPSKPKYRLDPGTLAHVAAKELGPSEVGLCNIAVDRPLAFESYKDNIELSRFILRDRTTDEPLALGLIHFALRRSTNVHLQTLAVDVESRAAIKGHQPCVVWFTGLSSSGKSTISNLVERQLNLEGCHTVLLDGDNVRHGLNRDLGFTEADRAENIRRIAEVAKLMTDAGLITLVSFISPFAAERRTARELVGNDQFVEVFVDAPIEVAEQRDAKGLYKKARAGEIQNFTGIGSPYEPPESPDLHLETAVLSAEESAGRVIQLLRDRGLVA